MEIREMQKMAYSTAAKKGFHKHKPIKKPTKGNVALVLAWLALVHTEVSEATEEARRLPRTCEWLGGYYTDGKPEGFGSELADVIIRVGDTAEALGIDLEKAVVEKMQYNNTRKFKHGKRI